LLQHDDRAFVTAASTAQKAADYLRGLALKEPPALDAVTWANPGVPGADLLTALKPPHRRIDMRKTVPSLPIRIC
jgi:hypothetical protein